MSQGDQVERVGSVALPGSSSPACHAAGRQDFADCFDLYTAATFALSGSGPKIASRVSDFISVSFRIAAMANDTCAAAQLPPPVGAAHSTVERLRA